MTLLSSFNPDDKCFVHALPRFGPGVGLFERRYRAEELEGKHEVKDNGPRCRISHCDRATVALDLCERHYRARRRIMEKLNA